jgi:predicted outer membrane repeat protein
VTITDCTFTGNSATESGGGIFNIGILTASNCTLTGNVAPVGGDVFNSGGVFLDCLIGDGVFIN